MTTTEINAAIPMFWADAIQYMLPDGRSKSVQVALPMTVRAAYQAMLARGHRLEAEMLRTGEVSVTISDSVEGEDIAISVTPNGPEVPQGIIEMLKGAEADDDE